MPPSPFDGALVLTGPTGSGKSAVALDLAAQLGGEIVAMDSMTLYRGMDVGTAKPTAAERAAVRHHLIDVLDPWEAGNVAWWLDRAAAACADVRGRGKVPLIVGGTPFYLKALLCGLFDAPPTNAELRQRLEADAARVGNADLHARLAAVDPPTAARLHPNDVRRVVRALEVWELTGRPISAFQTSWDSPSFSGEPGVSAPGFFVPTVAVTRGLTPPARLPCVMLDRPRDELYRRIDARVDAMLAAGWPDEVRRLRALPRPMGREAAQALGYRELLAHSGGGDLEWEEMVARVKTRTRQFAKRQLTWFRHLPGVVACPADRPGVAARVRELWAARSPPAGPLPAGPPEIAAGGFPPPGPVL